MRLRTNLAFLFVFAVGGVIIAGCGEQDPGPSAETKKESDRLAEIQTKTNGDWSKLNAEDKKYLVDLAHGSESSAKMLLGPPARPSLPPEAVVANAPEHEDGQFKVPPVFDE